MWKYYYEFSGDIQGGGITRCMPKAFTSILYGVSGNKFVAVGDNGKIAYSSGL
jgi:hypothetical protein